MKFTFGIFLSLIAVISAADFSSYNIYNPSSLFDQANQYQSLVTDLQEDIIVTITGLRSSLSSILKRTSNNTLSQTQNNILTIFEMDAPVRELIFVRNSQNTNCILNLRIQLNMQTEFSGFDASNCLTRYDRNVSSLIKSAFGTLAEYENRLVIIQMLVVNSFTGYNVWLTPEEIQNKFRAEYNQQKNEWAVVKENIDAFLATLESDIGRFNTVLGNCYASIQTGLVPQYARITTAIDTCTEFDVTNFVSAEKNPTKFHRNISKSVNTELVSAIDYLIDNVFSKLDRSTTLYSAFEDPNDFYLKDFKSQLLNFHKTRNHPYRLIDHVNISRTTGRARVINVILIENFSSFEVFHKQINAKVFSYSGYYLFALLKGEIAEIQKIFSNMWEKKIYNVNAIYEASNGAINMSTFRPFNRRLCDDSTPRVINQFINGSFVNNTRFFPKKFNNLGKCRIPIVTFERCPAVCIDRKSNVSRLYGHDWDLIKELERSLNFTINLMFLDGTRSWGRVYNNGTVTGALKNIVNEDAMIAIGNYFLSANPLKVMDTSEPYHSVPVVFAIPPGKRLSPFEKLLRPLDIIVWIFFIATIAFGFIVILIIEIKMKSCRSFVYGFRVNTPALNLLIAIFGSQQSILPRRNFARFILMMFLIFCLVLRNVYQGALYIFLQSDGRHKPMQSVDEMIENDYKFYIYPPLLDVVVGSENAEIQSRIKVVTKEVDLPFSREVDDTLHAAFLTSVADIMYRNQHTYKKFILKICSEEFAVVNIVMYFTRNFYLKDAINDKINNMLNAGIIHHWLDKHVDDRFLNYETNTSGLNKKLSMNHLFGVFNVMLIGYAIACISFIIEIILSKVKSMKNVKRKEKLRQKCVKK